jgi:hypothetical protein
VCIDFTVLEHFTKKSFHRKFLSERPFDRNTIWPHTVWPNAIWPKVHSTESPFNRTPFDRKFILPKGHITDFFSENDHLTESTFYKNVIWPKKIAHKVVWPKKNLTESSFDWTLVSKKGHLTERSFDRMFFLLKWSFSKNCHLIVDHSIIFH